MGFWMYSTVIPVAIIIVAMLFYRPLNFQKITKALGISLIPLITYTLLVYFLEMENYIDSSWAFQTLIFFFIPYLAVVLILNGIAWNKRRKAKTI